MQSRLLQIYEHVKQWPSLFTDGHREVLEHFPRSLRKSSVHDDSTGILPVSDESSLVAEQSEQTEVFPARILAREIKVEQIKLLLRHMPVVIGGSYLAFLILFFWVYPRVDSPLLMISVFLAMAMLTLVRTMILLVHRKVLTSVHNVEQRVVLLPFYSALAGLVWGVFAYLLVSDADPVTSLIVIMVLTGLVASATASLAHLLPAFALFSLLSMLPAALKFLNFDGAYFWVGILICLYLFASIRFARSNSSSATESINLRFVNLQLVDDLTEEKSRAESALLVAEQSNLAKSRFLAAASHDLRQPLHALRLLTATLESRYPESSQQLIVSRMNSSVQSLESLLDSLLDISRLDAGTIEPDLQHFELDQLLDRVNEEFSTLAMEKGLHCSVAKSGFLVKTDLLLLERVIRNLVSNAIRYTSVGNVSISSRCEDGSVLLTVSDTGMGVASGDVERVFEEFVQLDNPERDRSKGLGLGLSIVKRITDLLGIELDFQSHPGEGTTVTVSLPQGNLAGVREGRHQPEVPEGALDKILVVVIDDEEHVRDALSALLQEWNCSVVAVGSIDEALAILPDFDAVPDVILADYRLRHNAVGTDAIESLHEFYNQEIPALVITGDVAKERLQEINECGYPVLHKPCDPAILRSSLYRFTKVLF